MSEILKKLRQTSSRKEIGAGSSKKQRFIDATKTLLEIANESADTFPPLKSCLGGINALIKYYEGYKDVEEKLGDLVLWLAALKDSVTTTSSDGNQEEADRREQLTRSLEGIEKRSRKIIDKGKGARILDKNQDSGTVVKLLEELGKAILLYQLSQQRSIDNQVAQLTSSFRLFLKLCERAPEIKEKAESTLVRLGRFAEEGSISMVEGGSKRKSSLFKALEEIKNKLLSILERTSSIKYQGNDADFQAVGKLAEDVRDAVIEYQFGQQNAIHEQNCRLVDSADLAVLNSCRRSQATEYRHGNRRGCLKGTRDTVLNEIESWAKDFNKSPVFWLNGLAGTGKSTIAQTIAERLFAEGRLGASFFCSRDFEDRSNLHFIFPTLAFQLAHKYSEFRSHFVDLLRSDPDVVHESLSSQMQKLIVEPLQRARVSTVIVIDALDECRDNEPSSAILSVLGRFVKEIAEVKFLITGRPEPRIRFGFRLPLLVDSTDVFVLHHVHPSLIDNDIRLFLKHELSELGQRRKLEGWPTDEQIDLLCDRAAGLFVYAVATVRFLDSNTHLPKHRLDAILKLPGSTAPEGRTLFNPKTTLDSLYTSILRAAFSEEDPDGDSKVRTIIGTVVMVVNPLPPSAIAELNGLELEEVTLYLELVQSLVPLDEDSNQPIKPFHKSFPDFITDPSRCNTRFCVSHEYLHLKLATNCLRLMNEALDQDLLSLPEYTLNSEIKDLKARIDCRITVGLQYACRSWHSHLTETREETAGLIPYLRVFLETKFLAWLEVLSVLGDVGSASVSLEKLMLWLFKVVKDNQLLDTARDCFNFVTKFFEPISVSATHIYHSALELCPLSSIVRKLYYDRCHRITRFPRVAIGTQDSWDSTISFSGKDNYEFCTWSPCGRFVAALTRKIVEIRNQLTFELLTVLQSTRGDPLHQPMCPPAFSPDGRSLACDISNVIVIWDIQTGGVAREIEGCKGMVSLEWSLDGRTIATTLGYGFSTSSVRTYDVASGTQLFAEEFESGVVRHLWAYEKSFRFLTTALSKDDRTFKISISEIGPTLIEVESFDVESGWKFPEFSSFSPSTYRASILGYRKLRVLDIRSSDCLSEEGDFTSPQFSSNGSLLAASHWDSFRVWKHTSNSSYISFGEFLLQHLPVSSQNKFSLQFSPNSSSILFWFQNVLRVQHLHDLSATPTACGQHAAISCSGNRIATAHKSESIVTIIDLRSQAPPHFIHTGMEIQELFITGNVLLVGSSKEVVAWLLTEEGTMGGGFDNKNTGHSNSIWTISSPSWRCLFWVKGQIGVIHTGGLLCFNYHTGTGEPLHTFDNPRPRLHFYQQYDPQRDRNLRHPNPSQHDIPPEVRWLIPHITKQEIGWIMDPEGRHRFWVPVEWRKHWDPIHWHHNITTLFSNRRGQPVIIKF